MITTRKKAKAPRRKLPKWSYLEVEWEDIKVDSGVLSSHDFLETYKPAFRKTLGYLIDEDDKYVVIAETDDRKCDLGDGDIERVNTILRVNIIKITQLKPVSRTATPKKRVTRKAKKKAR